MSLSHQQPQSHILFSSDGSDSSEQVSSRQRLPAFDFPTATDQQLQKRQEEQRLEIDRLNQEHQQVG